MTTTQDEQISWSVLSHEDWSLHLASTEDGLVYVGSWNGPLDELSTWAAARLPGKELVRGDEDLRPYAEELLQYLQGKLKVFSVPFAFSGTPFQTSVWNALLEIPYGTTESYSDIAERIGRPAAVRAVGAAIGANPVLIGVPCHRVIGKSGALTGYRGGLEMKTRLLELEQSTPSSIIGS